MLGESPSQYRTTCPASLDEERDADKMDDASSIAFHFDCDEGLYSASGEHVPPWLSTVTYLSGRPQLRQPTAVKACVVKLSSSHCLRRPLPPPRRRANTYPHSTHTSLHSVLPPPLTPPLTPPTRHLSDRGAPTIVLPACADILGEMLYSTQKQLQGEG